MPKYGKKIQRCNKKFLVCPYSEIVQTKKPEQPFSVTQALSANGQFTEHFDQLIEQFNFQPVQQLYLLEHRSTKQLICVD
ncbi:MAG: hypothetical protein CSA44_01700 [Gammaproteobacteria bacterium]|nr:MAG: hypothetical protein CSA44_01700 [Gammaproteobacteria bacterium]